MPPRQVGTATSASPTPSEAWAVDEEMQAATLASVARTALNRESNSAQGETGMGDGEGGRGNEEPDPLTSFARHVLRSDTDQNHHQQQQHHHAQSQHEQPQQQIQGQGQGTNGPSDSSDFLGINDEGVEMFTQQPAQGFAELLESDANQRAEETDGLEQAVEVMNGLNGDDLYGHHHGDGRVGGEDDVHGHGQMGEAPPPPERSRRGKRRREDEERDMNGTTATGGEGLNGESMMMDPIRMKKDSHKEVERRRRENINDGINELAKYVPGGMDKGGKGTFLRKAAEYLGQMCDRVRSLEEGFDGKGSNLELQNELNRLQNQLAEEQERSMRYETSWREAEDRAAASQFELARLKNELEEIRGGFEAEH